MPSTAWSTPGLRGVEFIAANTDAQALQMCDADIKLNIGHVMTRGLGAGANPEVGQGARPSRATTSRRRSRARTWSSSPRARRRHRHGAAPVIAEIAKNEIGALTVGVVTKPFEFEGTQRMRQADEGIQRLREVVDTLIVIPNEKLLAIVERRTDDPRGLPRGRQRPAPGRQGITDLITIPGLINLDFADVRTIMSDAGSALMGIGISGGENRAAGRREGRDLLAAARGVRRGRHGRPAEHHGRVEPRPLRDQRGAEIVQGATDPNANIIFGSVIDEALGDEVPRHRHRHGLRPRARPPAPRSSEAAARPPRPRDRRPASASASLEIPDDEIDIPPFLR
jgi:cell division protein FtsZ